MNIGFKTKAALVTVTAISIITCIAGCVVPIGSEVGDNAPDFTLSTLDGGQVTLSELKGKPAMLVFWTTGCSACIYQMPSLEAAKYELGDNVEFVNIDIGESSYKVREAVDYYGFDLLVALDTNEAVSDDYNVIYTPTNVVIDSEGVIRYIRKGAFLNEDEILEMLSDLE